MRRRHDVGSPRRRMLLDVDPAKSQTLRHWRIGVNRIFVGKTSRYEYLCTLYDLARAHSRSPASRRHRICAVKCKYILKYIEKERARMRVKERTRERKKERASEREREREREREKDTLTVSVF